MNPKLMLLLFGALMLIGTACGDGNSPSGQLSILDKRRIIRNMLDAQKDIRQALKKIRRQIQGDLNSTGHNGAAGDDSSEEDDDDDIDEEMGGDGFGDMSGEEEEQHFKKHQKKLRESRERLDAVVKKIAASLIAVKEYIEKIDKKVDEAIRLSKDKNYTLYFHGKPGHHYGGGGRPEHPTTTSPYGTLARPTTARNYYSYGYGHDVTGNFKDALGNFKDIYGQTASDAKTPADDEPYKTIVGTGPGKKHKKPNGTYRTRKSLDGTIPTVDTEQLSSPDIPSIVGYEGPVQKTVEFQHNQQQVE